MDLKDLKVELAQHVGQQGVDVGGKIVVVDVKFDYCRVLVNNQYKGIYCGMPTDKDRVLTFIEPFPQAVQDAIAEKVAKITGGVKSTNAPPPEEHEVIDSE